MKSVKMMAGVCAMLAGAASADPNYFYIEAFAPETVMPGETFTVEFWGRIEHAQFVQGTSAVVGVGISALGDGDVRGLTQATFYSLGAGTNPGTIVGSDLIGVIGGQIPPIFCCITTDLSHPIRLFSFEVTAGESGLITYTPGLPSPNGALWFVVNTWNWSGVSNNFPGSTLILTGATTRIIPGPGAAAIVAIGLGVGAQPRRRESRLGVSGGAR